MAPPTPTTGPTNSLVDVTGLRVGHADRQGEGWLTGSTVVLAPPGGAVAGGDVRGGGPGTRETDLLDPRNLVERVHAITLSGGSAFGLAAADGVMRALAADGTGFPVGPSGSGLVVPIVPGAVIFDLGRGGGGLAHVPDAAMGGQAYAAASPEPPAQGAVGAGSGAQTGGLKGGVGTASTVLPDGSTVAVLVVVNATGSVLDPATGELWGARHLLPGDTAYPLGRPSAAQLQAWRDGLIAPFGPDGEEGGLPRVPATTIGVIGTDLTLTPAQCARVAGSGHDGMARAINPVHTMVDGDTLFTLATGGLPAPEGPAFHALLHAAGETVTRAIVRGVLAAASVTTPAGSWPGYREAFPSAMPSAT